MTYRLALLVPVLTLLCAIGCQGPAFVGGVQTEAKPWTDKPFFNNPDDFHFAIVSDRTGGERKGVFPEAIRKVNLLKPEFVLCVGDLIEGYSEDKSVVTEQWSELNGFLKTLDMPFFYVSGNHDISNAAMSEFWREKYGVSYYYFVYKNVLFMALNTQENISGVSKRNLSDAQVKWAQTVLAEHPEVRWTILYMHKPLWMYEEESIDSDGKTHPGTATGFKEIESALKGRPYTCFAGHWHQYTKYVRNGQRHFVFSTTGGGNGLRGPNYGEFYHTVWVTMTPNGPVLANLLLDGIKDENVMTEKMMLKLDRSEGFRRKLKFDVSQVEGDKDKFKLTLPIQNTCKQAMDYRINWDCSDSSWTITPPESQGTISSGDKAQLVFVAAPSAMGKGAPQCGMAFSAGDELEVKSEYSGQKILRQLERPEFRAVCAAKPVKVDGDLGDAAWQQATWIKQIRTAKNGQATTPTEAALLYDSKNFYVAIRCSEPNMDLVKAAISQPDGALWQDDSVELFLDTNLDRKTYYQLITNSSGIVFDALCFDKSVNFNPQVATAKTATGWTVEIAIPWENINTTPPVAGSEMGIALVRTKTQPREVQQLPVLYGGNHQPDMFANLKF